MMKYQITSRGLVLKCSCNLIMIFELVMVLYHKTQLRSNHAGYIIQFIALNISSRKALFCVASHILFSFLCPVKYHMVLHGLWYVVKMNGITVMSSWIAYWAFWCSCADRFVRTIVWMWASSRFGIFAFITHIFAILFVIFHLYIDFSRPNKWCKITNEYKFASMETTELSFTWRTIGRKMLIVQSMRWMKAFMYCLTHQNCA